MLCRYGQRRLYGQLAGELERFAEEEEEAAAEGEPREGGGGGGLEAFLARGLAERRRAAVGDAAPLYPQRETLMVAL